MKPNQSELNLKRRAAWLLQTASIALLAAPAYAQQNAGSETIEEIVVTGSSIRGTAPVGSSLVTMQYEEIAQSGVANTADLLAKIPQMGSFNSLPGLGLNSSTTLTATIDLRGVGDRGTLILVDGLRATGFSPNNTLFDISTIPPAAIERVEVVPDGSSAVYGSDAVAGVVNVILRSNMNGAEGTFRTGYSPVGYKALDSSIALGRTWGGGAMMIVAAYSQNSNVAARDLPFYRSDFTNYGGQDLRSTSCAPPNVRIGTTSYAAPNYNLAPAAPCDPGALGDVFSAQRRATYVANIHQDVTDNMRLWANAHFASVHASVTNAPASSTLTITNTNPFFRAPPGVTATTESVLFNLMPITGMRKAPNFGKGGNVVGGTDYTVGSWKATGSFNYGWGAGRTGAQGFNTTLLQAAAAARTRDTALDPFGTGTNPGVSAAIANWISNNRSKQSLYDATLKADGPLFTIPGGDIKTAVGVNWRKQIYGARQLANVPGDDTGVRTSHGERILKSVFGELFVPIVGPDNASPMLESLSISAAARYDDYSDTGGTTNPKIGATWSPVHGLSVRGSYGTSFHAADLGSLFAVDTVATYTASTTNVPAGRPTNVPQIQLTGSRFDLHSESAKTYSFGFDYDASDLLPGFRASLTYYDVLFKDKIQIPPAPPELFTNPGYARFVILDPTPAQIAEIYNTFPRLTNWPSANPVVAQLIDRRRSNYAATHSDGIDFSLNYNWDTDYGKMNASFGGNYVLDLEDQTGPGGGYAPQQAISYLKIRASVGWNPENWNTSLAVNYLQGYDNIYNTPFASTAVQRVAPFMTADLHVSYNIPVDDGAFSGIRLTFQANNLTNEKPPFYIGGGGYSTSANPLGRLVWLGVQKKLSWD